MSHLVYKAINKVQAALAAEGIKKDRTNTQGASYKYRGIDEIFNALAPLLAKNELCILPRMIARECTERLSKSGGNLFYVVVEAEFDFISTEDSSKHTIRTFGEAMDSSDKATNKAMSAAYKYAALQAFAIPTEGDHDSESQSHQVEPIRAIASQEIYPKVNPIQAAYSHSEASAEDVETIYSELLLQAEAGGRQAFAILWRNTNPVIQRLIEKDNPKMAALRLSAKEWEIKNGTVG